MTTEVNMKQAVAGATVHFRCGGSAVVYSYEEISGSNPYRHKIYFEGYGDVYFDGSRPRECYLDTGQRTGLMNLDHLDIIRIEQPKFKWEDAKRGMAFKIKSDGEIIHFVGFDMRDIPVFHNVINNNVYAIRGDFLTRAPEHDKVQP